MCLFYHHLQFTSLSPSFGCVHPGYAEAGCGRFWLYQLDVNWLKSNKAPFIKKCSGIQCCPATLTQCILLHVVLLGNFVHIWRNKFWRTSIVYIRMIQIGLEHNNKAQYQQNMSDASFFSSCSSFQ